MTANRSGPPDSAANVARLIELGLDREAAEFGAAATRSQRGPMTGGLMDPLGQMALLGPLLARVVGNITYEQLDAPTPCAKFAVRDVLDHMVTGAIAFAAAFRGTAPPASGPSQDSLALFAVALTDLGAAMQETGALDRTITAPFGAVEGHTFARFVALDGLVHGWDLSIATGQAYDPPDALVAEVTAFAFDTIDALRDGDTFAADVEPPADAAPIERLVAFTGRTVTRPS